MSETIVQRSLGQARGTTPGLTPPQQARLRPNNYPSTMSAHQDGPKLGATFYPGGQDDFYMPELISPSPQRVMPEVPTNMQEGIAHLELEAKDIRPKDQRSTSKIVPAEPSDTYSSRHRSPSETPGPIGYTANYQHTNASAYQNLYKSVPSQPEYRSYANAKAADMSKPSPFPKLRDAGPNVPPSDDEKEQVLERARSLVLNSNDPEMQLAWAQDALLWVDIAESSRSRLAENSIMRPGTPKIEHQLRTDSMNIVDFLANQGHPKAMFMKAMWNEFGKFNYQVDRKEAFKGYRRAAERGYARAEYRIGTSYEGQLDMAKAIKHYNIGVDMGDSASNYRLGMMSLLSQNGFPQDYHLGVQRIQYAADTADENAPQGAYVFGMLIARELPNIAVPESDLPLDIERARYYVEKAAYLGFAKAQLKMGSAYELCLLGCEFNPALSLHYNSLAARQNEAEAEMAISKWFLCGYEGVFDKNEELAFKYAQRAALSESPTAEFAMGYFYEIGMYVQSDLRQAQSWYQKAADHENQDAKGRLEGLAQHRTLSKKDHEQIAITRIKSQYGSNRGGRPERLREQRPNMPTLAETEVERVDMTIHNRQSRSGSTNAFMEVPPSHTLRQDNYTPARPKSTAPYPVDDEPHMGGFNHSPQLRPLSGPPADRPNSAFGIRPLVNIQPSIPDGRGSNPAGRHLVVSAGWEPQIVLPNQHRQSSPGRGPSPYNSTRLEHDFDNSQGSRNSMQNNNTNTGRPQPSPPMQGGSGYPSDLPRISSAPLTQSGPALRYDLPSQQPGFARGGTPNSNPNPNPYDKYPQDQRQSVQYPKQRHSSYPNSDGVNPYSNQRPERFDSVPQNSNYQARRPHESAPYGGGAGQTRPPTNRSSSAAPSTGSQSLQSQRPNKSAPPPQNTSAPASSPAKKQGPQTFGEMNIPQGKPDNECVVM